MHGDGSRITFTIITRSGETDKVNMGNVLVEQMCDAGFDDSFQPFESAIFLDDDARTPRSAGRSRWTGSATS